MPVIIESMYLPDNCRECELERENRDLWTSTLTHECPLTNHDTDEFRKHGRHIYCPLVAVPEEAADRLLEELQSE